MELVSVDDLVSPKVRTLSCEYCPFDLVCNGRCVLGLFEDSDPEAPPKAIAS